MAKKGNQQKKGLGQHSTGLKKGAADHLSSPLTTKDIGLDNGPSSNLNEQDVGFGEELPNSSQSSTKGVNGVDHVQDAKNSKKKLKKSQRNEKKVVNGTAFCHEVPSNDNIELGKTDMPTAEGLCTKDGSDLPRPFNPDNTNNSVSFSNGLHNEEGKQHIVYPETVVFKFLRNAALSVARSSADWVERHKPTFVSLKSYALKARDCALMKIQHLQPIVFRCVVHFWNLMLLLFMVWLDCTLRGINSLLRMGTTSFFSIIWCTILSVIAIIGFGKSLVALSVIAACGLFLGITFAALVSGIFAILFVWFYGNLWTTGFLIVLGGLALFTNHNRIGLFIATAYSIYCFWKYVGWLGLLLGLNLSFISSDALLFVLKNIVNDSRTANDSSEQASRFQGQPPKFSSDEQFSTSNDAAGIRADRGLGASTSGSDMEITSEDEIIRLLNCKDHYDALSLARFANIDPLVIKKEYRKKAMLVHPDKNMGNEKAAEAFKKLQNAHEVLMDASKQKQYDDELKREELLNYFRKLQNSSPENRRHGIFGSGFGRSELDVEDRLGELRWIACKKCGFFHIWAPTKKIKSKARWCQECKDFHQAKDGDGWVEQSTQAVFFGMLQQVEAPCAFVCAGGKVYDATEWYICQGMRCTVNTHKPTFQVNTNVVAKNINHTKGSSSSSSGPRPPHNFDETMNEEQFYEWLQNAVQSGMFDNFAAGSSSDSPSKSGGSNNGGGNGNNGSGSSKRKKKGKKPW